MYKLCSNCFSVLRQHFDSGQALLPIIYILATTFSIVLYFVVACMDPGFVKKMDDDVKEVWGKFF